MNGNGWDRYDEDEDEDEMDLALTGTGDIVIDQFGDLMLLGEEEAVQRQRIAMELFVNAPDYAAFPDFGANLDDLLGRKLDADTMDLGIELILDSVPDISDIYGILSHRYNSIVFIITHPAFNTTISLVYALNKGLLLGEEADALLHELFLEG